jgi:cytochrome c peroxidase
MIRALVPYLARVPRRMWWVIIPTLLLIGGLSWLALAPLPTDPVLPESEWGAGAVNIQPAWTGLLRDWPQRSDDFDPALANLGAQLFFDPILSGDNTRSCAHCHQPDWGFSEPAQFETQPDGTAGRRHTPTLWNVAYGNRFFWDGRAGSLEEQAQEAITSKTELNQNPDELVTEINGIEAYRTQFASLFSGGVTPTTIATALAAFERTLISDGSAFDAYAHGDLAALTAQQRQGLAMFRSAGARCFECHANPMFTDNGMAVTGVPDLGLNDVGAAQGIEFGAKYAFKAPTLRNVMLRGPYMHNGSLADLNAVIDHYAEGGKNFTLAALDPRLRGFVITPTERQELIAFLYGLTDEMIPEKYWSVNYVDSTGHILIPSSLPSGLKPITGRDNPGRQALAEIARAPHQRPECHRSAEPTTLTVHQGESIQAVVDCAISGDTIEVEPGVYHERVVVDQNHITLRGLGDAPTQCPYRGVDGRFPTGEAAPNWPILDGDLNGDGTADLSDGVITSGGDFTLDQFIIRNYQGNGALVEGVENVTLRNLFTQNTGFYGVYPVHATHVLIECMVGTGIQDAAVYVGQSRGIVVRDSLAYESVFGIELENSVDVEIDHNEVWGNKGGIIVTTLPTLASHVSGSFNIHDNYTHDNNFSETGVGVATSVPNGSGIYVIGGHDIQITHNRIENNHSYGLALVSMQYALGSMTEGTLAGIRPERVAMRGNTYLNNGGDPIAPVTQGATLWWDGSGSGNTFDEAGIQTTPPLLPSADMPPILQRMLTQFWATVWRPAPFGLGAQ